MCPAASKQRLTPQVSHGNLQPAGPNGVGGKGRFTVVSTFEVANLALTGSVGSKTVVACRASIWSMKKACTEEVVHGTAVLSELAATMTLLSKWKPKGPVDEW